MSKTTLLVLIDGLRHDYINADDAPFLNALGSHNPSGAVRETFAFQLRPAFLAGLQPEQCGVAHLYLYDPTNSPYRDLPVDAESRTAMLSHARQVERVQGHSASASYADPFAIPRQFLSHFSFSELLLTYERNALAPYPTVFDLMRAAGQEWLWIAYPTHDQRTEQILVSLNAQLRPTHRFVFLHFAELDWAGHEWGPGSDQQRDCLHNIDQALKQVYALVNQQFSEVSSVVFGDHGMVSVGHLIDIEGLLHRLDPHLGEEYVYFLDSTQARFWFSTDRARHTIHSALEALPGGSLLSESDLADLHFRFPDHRFGELIWVVEDKHVIFPNFFQRESPPKGMHGYLPEVFDNWGWLCVTGTDKTAKWEKPVEMTRIFPTLTQMLGLEIEHLDQEQSALVNARDATSPSKISIIIPTRNRAPILGECLQALDAQTYSHDQMEIIVIDDASTDNTSEVVADFAERTDITTTYEMIPQSGPAAARNRGIQLAQGHVVLFIGDDIIATPGLATEHMNRHLSELPFSQAILGHTTWHPQMEITPFMEWLENGGPQFSYGELENAEHIGFGAFWTSNISLKRDFLQTHGKFDEQFSAAVWEDIELGCRLQQVGLRIDYARDALAHHKHPTSLSQYAHRQHRAGYFAALVLDRCPQLEENLLQRAWFGNPLLVLDRDAIWALIRHVEAESVHTDSNLLTYEAILAWFFAHGLLEGLEKLGLPQCATQDSVADFLLNRVLRKPAADAPQLAPPGQGSPAPQGIWVTLGELVQVVADRVYARLPGPIARFYMRARRRVLGQRE